MNRLVLGTVGIFFVLGSVVPTSMDLAAAATLSQTLGEQDFNDGEYVGIVAYQNASSGEPAPFDAFRGADSSTGSTFDESWVFSYGPQPPVTAASITMGLYDHDSAADLEQVALFEVNGEVLTSELNVLLEAHGGGALGSANEYNTYTLDLPSSTFPDLALGTAAVSLRLQNGYGSVVGSVPNNGAGLDFSTLELTVVPEPATLALLGISALGLMAFAIRRRKVS